MLILDRCSDLFSLPLEGHIQHVPHNQTRLLCRTYDIELCCTRKNTLFYQFNLIFISLVHILGKEPIWSCCGNQTPYNSFNVENSLEIIIYLRIYALLKIALRQLEQVLALPATIELRKFS